MRVCKILAFSIYEWQLCHCNWWPEIQKWQFLPPPPSTQKLQTFTVFSCHRFSKKFSLPDRRARFHRFPGYLLRIFFIGLIILGIMVQNWPWGRTSWPILNVNSFRKNGEVTFFAPDTQATIWSKSLLLRVPSCDSHAVCSFLFDPIIQSSRENATPFSGTSPLASYKEVPSPPWTLELARSTTVKY